ncbi:hypothetical protein BDDG_01188 [Blastomyces dermatitidis ATCC 18188]|uniref:Uncharacterized protein n=1 Tax=Ajellomyces dermatitidis (strain ATCC 18188 / CBS 674.68) TaxID=653446 RepID=F2T526_AJEDA|nr:hypothetical protein BDDG_01188 [Blastomyces dermatitidis ATCC 18188]EQL37650.1 hypothetical protein BDFG_01215 [Blastomyces dermatitidis ATCC 26199]
MKQENMAIEKDKTGGEKWARRQPPMAAERVSVNRSVWCRWSSSSSSSSVSTPQKGG